MFKQTVLTDAFSVTVKSLYIIYCQCNLSLSGIISQTCTFSMISGLFIFIAWARFVMINTCSKLTVASYVVSQSLACVVGNVWTSAKLIFFHLAGCPSLLFQVCFLPHSQFLFCDELLVLPVCSKPVSGACLTVCISTVCVLVKNKCLHLFSLSIKLKSVLL